jgi:hypothetical protein
MGAMLRLLSEKDLLPELRFQEHTENNLCGTDRDPALKLLSP